jgi:hypothetical protein
MDIGELMADLSVQAGAYSAMAAKVVVPVALVGGVAYFALNRGDTATLPPPGGAPPATGDGEADAGTVSTSAEGDAAQSAVDVAPPAAEPSQASSGVGVR